MNSNIRIKCIYLENFKLFDNFKIDFSNGLNVFDGPNGYGKTSMFDAIEYLITGDIKRVTTCHVLDGKYKYQKVFFAKDYRKDVIVKAEFTDGKDSFVLVKRVEGHRDGISTVDNNPKKLKEITKTYIIPDFEYAEYDEKYLIPIDELNEIQIKCFGSSSQTLFSLLYYIQQEDRLDYFKSNEIGRVGSINTLFQINSEKEKFEKIKQTKKKLSDLIKSVDKQIEELQRNVCQDIENMPGAQAEYHKLLKKEIEWDKNEPSISNKESLDYILHTLKNVKELVLNQENYNHDLVNQNYNRFLGNEMINKMLEAYLILDTIGEKRDEYEKKKEIFSFLNTEINKVKSLDYININYTKMGEFLHKEKESQEVVQYVEEYKQITKTAQSAQKSINELLRVREQLIASIQDDLGLHDSKCPFCGYDWKEKKVLVANIQSTTEDLDALLGSTGKHLKEISDTVQKLYLHHFLDDMNNMFNNMLENPLFLSFFNLEKHDSEKASYVREFLIENNIECLHLDEFTVENMENSIEKIKTFIKEAIVVLPEEYYLKKQECEFDRIFKDNFIELNDISEISLEAAQEKEKFLEYQFVLQEKKKSKQVDELIRKSGCLKNEILKKMDSFMKDWKTSINKYQGNIISKIEIPFYIYSARILQSYQGGQGILIRDRNTKDEVDAIRFTTPDEEHDVLYTMSSGQLSGILLSFSLSLHKIFANDGPNVLFIDDPVQCMDDLNIVSFVELMRTEFPDIQLLISTHEKNFANFIVYKYKKYNLPLARCNLKEITEN